MTSVYQTQLITAAALTEGPAFVSIVAYMLEGTPWALGLSLVLIVAVALHFPTRARIDQWINSQLQQLDQERQSEDKLGPSLRWAHPGARHSSSVAWLWLRPPRWPLSGSLAPQGGEMLDFGRE